MQVLRSTRTVLASMQCDAPTSKQHLLKVSVIFYVYYSRSTTDYILLPGRRFISISVLQIS
jgi:hypothetical protein